MPYLPSMPEPLAGEGGINLDGKLLPLTAPLAYTPCKGDIGADIGGKFFPLEPFGVPAYRQADFPLPEFAIRNNYSFPNTDQISMAVSWPDIAPYDRDAATQERTYILDTPSDDMASPADKADPNYKPNPGIRILSKTHLDFDITKFNDTQGVAYLWSFQPVVAEARFVRSNSACGMVYIRAVDPGKSILYGTAYPPATPYPSGGIAVTSANTHIYFKFSDGPEIWDFYIPVNAKKEPPSFWKYFVSATAIEWPHPALRAGQTRYSFPSNAATGTAYTGDRFTPGTNPQSGLLKVNAYRYGFLLSAANQTSGAQAWGGYGYPIVIKIGKMTVAWSKATQKLTLSTLTPLPSILYTLDGGTPDTPYTIPIDIAATSTVRFKATKGGMIDSDIFSVIVTYDGVTPPDDFAVNFWSDPYAEPDNNSWRAALEFQRRANWYASPAGGGNGESASAPDTLLSILGTPSARGKSRGYIQIQAYYDGISRVYLWLTGGDLVGTEQIYYGLNGAPVTTLFAGSILLTQPSTVQFIVKDALGNTISRVFTLQRIYSGTSTVNAAWDLPTKILTLSSVESVEEILYDVTATPLQLYTGLITVAAPATYRVKLWQGNYRTNIQSVNPIDPNLTPSFSQALTMTWTGGSSFQYLYREPDIVWSSEGVYQNPTGATADNFYLRDGVVLRGGFNAAFTERNTTVRKSVLRSVAWATAGGTTTNDNLISGGGGYGFADGLWGESAVAIRFSRYHYYKTAIFFNCPARDCHIDFDESLAGVPANRTAYSEGFNFFNNNAWDCSASVQIAWGNGGDGGAGERGGDYTTALRAFFFSGVSYRCDASILITVGNGGNGNAAQAGSSSILCGGFADYRDGIASVAVTVGNGGQGGNEGTYADGGAAINRFDGFYGDDSVFIVSLVAGNGGQGGYISGSHKPGGPVTAQTAGSGGSRSTFGITTLCGNAGNDSGTVINALSYIDCIIKHHTEATLHATSGNAGTISQSNAEIYLLSPATGNIYQTDIDAIASAGTAGGGRGWVDGPRDVVYWPAGAVAITESGMQTLAMHGNPVRVNGLNGGAAWYSGTPVSDGVPLAGYETPQGGGTALGRFWE